MTLTNASFPKPGLVFDGTGPGGLEVELWQMDEQGFGSFVAAIPAPLGIGTVMLADGRSVKGFLYEAHATRGAEDITAFSSWSAWLGRSTGVAATRKIMGNSGTTGRICNTDRTIVVMGVILGWPTAGALLTREGSKSASIEWQVCAMLTEPEVRLGPLPRV